MDSSIVIRTALVKNGNVYFQVGGGIVADSNPEAEYQETLDKAQGFFRMWGHPKKGHPAAIGCPQIGWPQ
jgi:anthranilate/para-aminobenzoate synthase component I